MKGRLLAGLLLVSLSAGAQAGIGPAGAAILAKIRSHDPSVRAQGQRELAASRALLTNPDMGRSLADVLIADMKWARRAIRGEAPPLTEARAELYSDLLGIVARAYGYRDPYIRRALVFGAYDPGSKFAYDLAGQGANVLPDVLDLARDPIDLWRAQAIGIFGFMLERRTAGTLVYPLSPRQAETARRAILSAAQDKDLVLRDAGVRALGAGGNLADIPLLRHISENDPTCAQNPRAMNLCWQALRSIQRIKARAAPRGPAAPPHSAATPAVRRDGELGAADLASRVRALRQIRATPRLLQDPQVGRAMAKILSADTDPLSRSSRIWRGAYNEDWAEFDAGLAATLETNFGFADPDIARALVRAPYQPQSAFAASIARQGGAVIPELEVLLARGVPTVQAQAIGVFGFMLADRRDRKLLHPLSAAQEDLVRRAVLAGAQDKSLVVRDAAVQSLGFGGEPADIGLLRRIAATDPSCAQNPKGITICKLALKAIQKIEARAQRGPGGVR